MKIGSYFGNDPARVAPYEGWLGRAIDNVLFYINQSGWSAFDSSVGWAIDLWKPVDRPVIWSVPLTVEGTSLASVAQGLENAHFIDAARQLAASRPGDASIDVRLGWEFNGSWMPWAAQGHEADFKQAYQTVVDQFRSVSDRFRFVWDVNVGGSFDPATAYPGDAYVDVIGSDFYYNKTWDPADPAAAFQAKASEDHGLQWISDFAAVHGKAFAVSEWGVQTNDSGAYIEAASAWFEAHNVAFANYWETNAAGFNGSLDNGSKPDAAKAYLAAFGSLGDDHGGGTKPGALLLRVSADAFEGDAQFSVSVDGRALPGLFSTHASHSAGQVDTITIDGDFSHASTVAVTFVNDLLKGSTALDRNLFVDSISIGASTVSGSQAANFAGVSVGSAAGLYANGSAFFRFAPQQPNHLTVTVSEDAFRGDAEFKLFVDGLQIGGVQSAHASHALGQTETINLDGLFSGTPNEVRIEFLNDLYLGDAGADRNLYVSQLSVNGHGVDGSAGANGAGWNQGQTAGLYSNGALVFHPDTSGWI